MIKVSFFISFSVTVASVGSFVQFHLVSGNYAFELQLKISFWLPALVVVYYALQDLLEAFLPFFLFVVD